MDKIQKEKWILDNFIEIYNKNFTEKYKFIKRIPQHISPGPDFIIKDSLGHNKGIEVTALFESPSTLTAQQRFLENYFKKRLESNIDKTKFRHCLFTFHHIEYHNNKKELEERADKIIECINYYFKAISHNDFPAELIVEDQVISIHYRHDNKNSSPIFLFFYYGENGATDINRQSFFIALQEVIKKKNEASQNYDKRQSNRLVIYDNTRYSIFINDNDIVNEISKKIGSISSREFENIWLLSKNKIFKINN
ncbi:MAG: hypothetical protein Q8O13_04395 [Candidatus Omnitrophota bacterium]|nr:hypothetical protein [Candidatus Omnitrophota bacterium]